MALFDQVDKDGLLEYSVVFNDRSLNSMSKSFQSVMQELSMGLRSAYNADATILVPGVAPLVWKQLPVSLVQMPNVL